VSKLERRKKRAIKKQLRYISKLYKRYLKSTGPASFALALLVEMQIIQLKIIIESPTPPHNMKGEIVTPNTGGIILSKEALDNIQGDTMKIIVDPH